MNEMDIMFIMSLLILISVCQLYLIYDSINRRSGMAFLEWFIGNEDSTERLLKEIKKIVNNASREENNASFLRLLEFSDKIKKEINDDKDRKNR